MPFSRVLRAEVLKTRRTRGLFLALTGPLVVTLIVTGFFIDGAHQANPAVDPWKGFIRYHANFFMLLYPLFAALVGFMLSNIEHKNNGFKNIFTQPAPKGSFYFSKVLILLSWLGLSLLVSLGFLWLAGYLLGFVFPDYAFAKYALPANTWAFYFRLFVALISIVAIHFFLSLYFDNFIVAVGSAVFLVIFGAIAVRHESGWLLPYTHSVQAYIDFLGGDVKYVDKRIWISLGYGAFFFLAGYALVARKNISS